MENKNLKNEKLNNNEETQKQIDDFNQDVSNNNSSKPRSNTNGYGYIDIGGNSGNPQPNPHVYTSIYVDSLPKKTTYKKGESLDLTGLVVKGIKTDGTIEIVNDYSETHYYTNEKLLVTIGCKDKYYNVYYTDFNLDVTYKTDYTITSSPIRRIYKEGETFDYASFSATLTYSDGTEITPNGYTCNLTTPLTVGVNEVKIICVENGIDSEFYTKIPIAVEVFPDSLSKCKLNQSELKFDCMAGISSVNLYNRRLLFEHSDVSLGIGTYQFDISHVYNSHFIDELDLIDANGKPIKTGMGLGFKLNVQQYLIPANSNSYKYIDSAGLVHSFVKLGNNTYYDQSGLGLILTNEIKEGTMYQVLSDVAGNKLYFKECRLVISKSCEGENNEKIYNYNTEGYLTEVYDERSHSNKVTLSYKNGYLEKMTYSCDNKIKEISFTYSAYKSLKLLTRIVQDGNGMEITYNGKNIIRIVSYEDESALFFSYTENTLNKVETGVYESIQISNQSYEFISDTLDVPTYTKVKSIPKNANNVLTMVYYFNQKGFTTSILEDANGDMSDLKYPEKLPGTSIGFKNGETLNKRINYQQVHRSVNGSALNFAITNDLINYRKLKYTGCKYYQVSFWLKLTNSDIAKPKIFVTINSQKNANEKYTYENSVFFDNTAINSWQYVTVPVEIEGEEITDINFRFLNNSCYEGEFADPRLTYSTRDRYYLIKQFEDNTTMSFPLDDIKAIRFTLYNSDDFTILHVYSDIFITGKDIESTYIELYKSKKANLSYFTLSLCNGTKKFLVKDAEMIINAFESAPFGFIDRGTHKMALYNTEIVTPEGTITSCVFTDFYPEFNGYKDVICKHTNSNRYGDKGKEAESDVNVYCDIKGKLLRKIDEYGVTIDYTYDTYGNVIRKTMSHPLRNDVFIFDASFTDSEKTETTAVSESSRTFNSLGLITSSNYDGRNYQTNTDTNIDTVEYGYDLANRLCSVSNGTNENMISYNLHGKIAAVKTLKDKKNLYGYNVQYDDNNTPCRFFKVDKSGYSTKVLEKNTDYSNSKTTIKQYRTDTPDESDVYVDKYGRVIKTGQIIGTDYVETTYNRQNLWESAGAGKITYYDDPYDNKSYEYCYDEFNQVSKKYCYYNLSGMQSYLYTITSPSVNKNHYDFGDYRRTLTTIKNFDKSKILNPRISNVMVSEFTKTKAEYEYDAFGRITIKKLTVNSFEEGNIPDIQILNSYKSYSLNDASNTHLATNLKSKIMLHDKDEKMNEKYVEIDYNDRGLVKKTNYKLSDSAVLTTYEYDKHNRLIKETTGNKIKKYFYNVDGTISSIKDNNDNILSEYKYIDGELNELKQDGDSIRFSYDRLGNITSMVGQKTTNLEWERGSLLKKYGNNEYSYNSNGLRYRKKVGNNYTHYIYDGSKLLGEKTNEEFYYTLGDISDNSVTAVEEAKTYLYDAEGIIGFTFLEKNNSAKDITYLYAKDHLDNVIAIYDRNGNMVTRYSYDSWGNCTIEMDKNDVGANNPIRWKSQYQDIETGLYFIEGRYYSPTLRQFLSPMSADAMVSLCPMPNSLYPYSLSLTNPINSVYNSYTVDTFDGIVHDPESLSKFEYFWFIQVPRFWNSKVGKCIAIGLAAVAVVAAVVTTAVTGCLVAIKLLGGMTLSSGMLFMLTGAVFALAASNGSSFWDNFVDYITNNWSQTLATLSISYIAALAFTALTSPDLCFKEGTLVETKDGLKPIEEIKEGDLVLAFDENTGEQAFKPVVQLFRNTTDKWYHITANGEEIVCTAEHPFFVVGLGFVPAKNLSVADKLLSSDNAIVNIDSIFIETLSTPETTYNFEVAGFHTYYVSKYSILVHNTCETIGKSHGAAEHRAEIDSRANGLKASGKYNKIYLNRSLKTAGVNDMGIRPDIIAIDNDGFYYIVEVASKSQASGTPLKLLKSKMDTIDSIPNVKSKLVKYTDYVK